MLINEAGWERTTRGVLGVVLGIIGYRILHGSAALAVVLMIVGLVLLVTGLIGYCPVWQLLHISTNKQKPR